jgi:hypothetical protein
MLPAAPPLLPLRERGGKDLDPAILIFIPPGIYFDLRSWAKFFGQEGWFCQFVVENFSIFTHQISPR